MNANSKILVLVLLMFAPKMAWSLGGERQKVYSLVKQKQSIDWYKTQAKLWKGYLAEHKTDPDAWLNYYTASRMLKIYNEGVNQEDLNKIVQSIKEAIPNSFEYHYISGWNGGAHSTEEHIDHLRKAQELGPNRVELFDDLLLHYELDRDKENLIPIAKKWYASNDISPGIYAWNYNMLQSTEEDAILITNGDNDTYPALVLQYAKGIRSDVSVINNSLFFIESYRNKYLAELGIPKMKEKQDDFKHWEDFQKAFIDHLKSNSSRPLYFAISATPSLYEDFKDEVHNVGMAYKWSRDKFDNIAVTKRNFEKKYVTDYIKFECYNDISQGVVDHMNTNYLISLLTLYNHYQESEDEKAQEVETLISTIAEKNNLEDRVAEVLNKPHAGNVSHTVEDPRIIEKYFVKITDSVYAGQNEVTNELYDLFLTDLLKQKRFDDLLKAKSDKVEWRQFLPASKMKLSEDEIFANGKPTDADFPVVNISHEAATMFCEWMTEVYNGIDHKRKKHIRVEFRLPTEKEWENLAYENDKSRVYAWGGRFVRNSKGCYITNLQTGTTDKVAADSTESECGSNNLSDSDGGYFPVIAGSYFPNNSGLYNLTGNVSEMVKQEGICKGGGWNTKPVNATISSKQTFSGPSPEVGFRVIMIIK